MLKTAVVAGAMVIAAGGVGLWAKPLAMHPTTTTAATISPYDLQMQPSHRHLPAQEMQDFSVVFP
jgi:hypothetical protein